MSSFDPGRVMRSLSIGTSSLRRSGEGGYSRDYRRLLVWRDVVAEELDIALHEVLPTRSLQELVRLLPMDRASLKNISGIGRGKLKRFAAHLLGIVGTYCVEKDIAAKPAEPSKVNTKRELRPL